MKKPNSHTLSRQSKRLLTLLLALLLVLTAGLRTYASSGTGSGSTLSDLQNQKDEAQKRLDEINQQIKDAKALGAQAKDLRAQYAAQQKAIEENTRIINDSIDDLNDRISVKLDEIEKKQAEFDARWAGFKERMAAMQMLNDGGSIALLSSVTNLYELLTFGQTLNDIANRDREVCEELETEREELDREKAELDGMVADLEAEQAQLEEKVKELAANIKEQDERISEIEAQKKALEASYTEQEKIFKDAEAALQAYWDEQNKKYDTPIIDGPIKFGVPIAYYSYISNHFGTYGTGDWRTSPHSGTDLVAPNGTKIYAAADGIVSVSHTWDGHTKTGTESYGNYVMIKHGIASDGKEYVTIYAHMNATPVVKAGATVKKGDLIGYVGHTGNVVGNPGDHLHLEMRINNVRVDAEKYIPLR